MEDEIEKRKLLAEIDMVHYYLGEKDHPLTEGDLPAIKTEYERLCLRLREQELNYDEGRARDFAGYIGAIYQKVSRESLIGTIEGTLRELEADSGLEWEPLEWEPLDFRSFCGVVKGEIKKIDLRLASQRLLGLIKSTLLIQKGAPARPPAVSIEKVQLKRCPLCTKDWYLNDNICSNRYCVMSNPKTGEYQDRMAAFGWKK